jgi:penicillin-binding protein 1A
MTPTGGPWLGVLAESLRLVAQRLRAAADRARPFVTRVGGPLLAATRRVAAPVGAGARVAGQRARQRMSALGHSVYHALASRNFWLLLPKAALFVGLPLLGLSAVLYANCGFNGCPDIGQLTAYQPGGAPVLLDRDGERFADLAPYERVVVSLDSLPEHVPAAFIAVEDRRFWDHDGVDWVRAFGAAWANVRSRSFGEGFSTIPMQLARNIFPEDLPGSSRTPKRKIEEVRVARLIEDRFDKRAILEMYLNHIYFGGGAYGIDAASRLYFGKPAARLTVPEAATLAGLPKAPSHYDPRRRPEQSRARRDLVLTLMEQQALLDPADAQKARAASLTVREGASSGSRFGVPLGAYFIDVVRDLLEERFGERLYRSRLRIYTTLDVNAQRAAERELANQLQSLQSRVRRGPGDLQGAVVVMDALSGDVMALVGGRDPVTRYNRAILGARQLGSSFKPFVFAAALQEGVPTSQVLVDMPVSIRVSRGNVWEPSNYDGQFEGAVSLRNALVRSRNIPTVRLASDVGIADVANTARAAGVHALMDETPSLALGTVATSPLELAGAYTTFATLGHTASPRFVMRVEDEDGQLLWEPPYEPPVTGMDPRVAYIITDILQDAVTFGTGTGARSAGYYGPAAGKTGTTNDATDAWFAGYTPELVGVVWIGYDQPSSLGSAATGGGYAAPVWGRIMRQIYSERPMPDGWSPPSGLVWARVDPTSGYVLQQGCYPRNSGEATEVFLTESVPPTICPYRSFWGDLWRRISGREDEGDRVRRPEIRELKPSIRRGVGRRRGNGPPGDEG